MRESESSSCTGTMEISGRRCPHADKIVRRKFAEVAKLLWPKPDVVIATIAGCDPRTGRRIMRGEVDVPLSVALAAVAEMVRPLD